MAKSHEIARTGNALKLSADKIVMLPVSEVRPYEKNPRKNADAVKFVKASIEQFGFKVPIIIDSNRVIVCGHTRLLAAKSLGMSEVPCIMADDLTDEQIKAFRLADNKVGEFAEWDMDLLGEELDAIADACDIDMGDFGFDLSDEDEETEVVEDEVPEEVEPVCKKGEIWQLGEHRLMCGDSTDADAVAKLMNVERADLVFTDPPYGMFLDVDYDGMFANDDTRAFDTGKRFDKVKGDNDDFKPELITTIFDNFGDCTEVFIWGADYFSELIPNRKDGSWVVWDKRCSEEMDKVAGNTFELCWSKAKHKRLIARIEWSGFHGMNGADSGKRVHPTQKPIALIDFFIKHWGDKANIIVDLFGGSGSTMIACEQLGRKCRMMELDPHYCDVIIARWEKLTGQKAVKLEG